MHSEHGNKNIVKAVKDLKECLRLWNMDVFGNIDDKVKAVEQEFELLEGQKELKTLLVAGLSKRRALLNELRSLYRMQESIWYKKPRVYWCNLRDKNNRFFHLSATKKENMNAILSLSANGKIISKSAEVKLEIVSYYKRPLDLVELVTISDSGQLGVSLL